MCSHSKRKVVSVKSRTSLWMIFDGNVVIMILGRKDQVDFFSFHAHFVQTNDIQQNYIKTKLL